MHSIPNQLKNQFPEEFLKRGIELFQDNAYENFDFIRNSYHAQFSDKNGVFHAVIRKKPHKDNFVFSCTCKHFYRHQACPHLAALLFIIFSKNHEPKSIYDSLSKLYYSSIWTELAKESYELYGNSKLNFSVEGSDQERELNVSCKTDAGQFIFDFTLAQMYRGNILGKYRDSFFSDIDEKFTIEYDDRDLPGAEKTDLEERMNLSGFKSWQQKFEESLWFDLSKIWFLTINEEKLVIDYLPSEQQLLISSPARGFNFRIQKNQISNIINALKSRPSLKGLIQISEEKMYLNYSLKMTNSLDLKITPVLLSSQGEELLVLNKKNAVQLASFGDYLHLTSKGFFRYEKKVPVVGHPAFGFQEVLIPNEKIPAFIQEHAQLIDHNIFYYMSPSLTHHHLLTSIDTAKVIVHRIKDDWCYLDVKYQILNETISFSDIYESIQKGNRFLIGKEFWIDLNQSDFDWIHDLKSEQIDRKNKQGARVKLNRIHLLRLKTTLPNKSEFVSNNTHKKMLKNLIQFTPNNHIPELDHRNYVLRDYQKNGYAWLWFLYENKLSGLLCDDMGLGKTYQSIALLEAVTMIKDKAKFLVVCPTSVIPHWRDKLSQFKKRVHLHVYHGSERELKHLSREKYSVILTSYGVMRNDLHVLEKIPFEILILDEIQIAKNKTSLTNAALLQLNGTLKIGLTGTPLENELDELKSLFDIVLPEYLGSDSGFRKKFTDPIEQGRDKVKLEQLHRIINPFTLRRTKSQVLSELPPKTEEIRTCELSPDQVKLYRDVILTRGRSLIEQLSDKREKVPYMHIFAVLNYLKQICNHPSQLEKNNVDYQKYQSGKWDLFSQLLEESLNSGFKVVIFSQYLNMLALIEAYLNDIGIQFATIKGSTRNREEMIERFNNDPNCMVFTGSLKASGLGINLIGGSVVIHYDRWWNAAREDQATDRVHRIGQTRGVQVFKLITEGTLEEKIDRLIRKKKNLFESLVKEDDADTIKQFDRDELIGLLTFE